MTEIKGLSCTSKEMLLILSNTPITVFCLNPCLEIPAKNFCQPVIIHVIKHDMDPNSYLSNSIKTPLVFNYKQ